LTKQQRSGCDIRDLTAGALHAKNSDITYPKWIEISSSQRDEYAEKMGY